MPLDPKQQPPYYTPTTATGGQGLQNLYTVPGIIESDGTNLTTTLTYSLPANTLQNLS